MQRLKLTLITLFFIQTVHAQIIAPGFAPRLLRTSINANIVAVQVDQKLLVSSSNQGFVGNEPMGYLSRLHPNGLVDTTFHYSSELGSSPTGVGLQNTGRIVIAGNLRDSNNQLIANVMRLLPNGQLDKTFTPFLLTNFNLNRIKILPNQKIFIAGFLPLPTGGSGVVYTTMLLLPNGELDPHFPVLSFTNTSNNNVSLDDIGFQSSNELILAGSALRIGNRTQKLFRLDSLGIVDSTFNPSFTTNYIFSFRNIAISPEGMIGVLYSDFSNVAIFDRHGQPLYARNFPNEYSIIHPLGKDKFVVLGKNHYEIEPTKQGFTTVSNLGINDYVFSVFNQGEDYIVFAGRFTQVGSSFKAGLARIKTTGSFFSTLDETFSAGFYNSGVVNDVLIQQDGKIIIGGLFHLVNGVRINHLARLFPNGELDPSFNPNLANPQRAVNKIRQLSTGDLVVASVKRPGFDGKLNGLNLIGKDGNALRTLNFPYFGGATEISYLALDKKDKIYAGENVAYRLNLESGQTLVRFAQDGRVEANYNDLYINSLIRYNGLIVQPDDKLLIYGQSLRYDNSDSTAIIRALPDGQRDQTFITDLDKNAFVVSATLLSNNEIVLGGYITDNKNINRPFLAKLDSLGKKVDGFNADVGSPTGGSFVRFITKLPNGQLFVSGSFNQYEGQMVSRNIVIDKNGKFVSNYFPDFVNPSFNVIVPIDAGHYYLGGSFLASNGASALIKVASISTSTQEQNSIQTNKKGKIFPNPSFGETLQLEMPREFSGHSINYQIFELGSGKVLLQGNLVLQTLNSINISNLVQAQYVLRLSGQNWEEAHPFSKLRP